MRGVDSPTDTKEGVGWAGWDEPGTFQLPGLFLTSPQSKSSENLKGESRSAGDGGKGDSRGPRSCSEFLSPQWMEAHGEQVCRAECRVRGAGHMPKGRGPSSLPVTPTSQPRDGAGPGPTGDV